MSRQICPKVLWIESLLEEEGKKLDFHDVGQFLKIYLGNLKCGDNFSSSRFLTILRKYFKVEASFLTYIWPIYFLVKEKKVLMMWLN